VNEMVSRLDTYRNELALQTLVVLNTKVGGHMENHGQRFDRLEHKDDDIIEAISISQKSSAREVATFHQQTREQLREVIAAILTHRDGQTTTISQPIQQPTSWVLTDEGHSRQCMTLQTIKPSDKADKSRIDATASLSDFSVVQRRVLEYLSFRKIRDREDEVAPADQDTFKWIFDTPKRTQRPWNNFSEWMRTGEGCYWINGKAGSGKSTLMKYMFNEKTVKRALSEWAGKTRLVVASYFSWNLGSPLQKSQVGLLRSFLHDILDQVPDLIPTVLPKLCRAASVDAKEEPSLHELKNGILRLAQQTDIPLRICLFVDGIDEFEKDHIDIVNLFVCIPSTQCKVVVSSRPLPVCFDALGGCPSLRLQDLTHDDIRSYADKKVRTHKRWRAFLEEEGQEAEKIVDVIAEKAEGVFLWVILAVASLLEGLRNYDRLMDFQRRLEILPPDLENLYSHMLNKMQPLYLRQASQLLQIILRHTEFEADQPLSALQLSFAEEENPGLAFSHEIGELPIALRLSKCRAMEGRLRSRCCGLIEIWQDWRLNEDDRILKSRVIFLHRTVVEFLRNPEVISDLFLHTTAVGFDPNIALAKGFLIDVKTQPQEQNPDNIVQSPTWQSMRRCLLFCRISENDTSQRAELILNDLDKAMKVCWTSINSAHIGSHGCDQDSSSNSQKFDWATTELRRPCCLGDFKGFDLSQASIFVLAATLGLRQYIFYRCTSGPSKIKFAQVQQAMRATVFRASCLMKEHVDPQSDHSSGIVEEKGRTSLKTYIGIIDDLLSAGADPNHSLGIDGYSPWALALTFTEAMPINTQTFDWCCLLSLFLASGADPNESIRKEGRYLVRHKTVLSMLTTKTNNHLARQKLREPVPNDEVTEGLRNLEALLIKRGATNREWSEPTEQKHERDPTPAPWISINAPSRWAQIYRKRDNTSVTARIDDNPCSSEEDSVHGYTRSNDSSAKASSKLVRSRRGRARTQPNDPSVKGPSSGDSTSSEEDSGPDYKKSKYLNLKARSDDDWTSSKEDSETESTEQSLRHGRSPTRDHTVSRGKYICDGQPTSAEEEMKSEYYTALGILTETPAVGQQEGNSDPAFRQLETPPLAQPSPDGLKNCPKLSASMDVVKTSKVRKPKILTSFSSLFRHRRRSAR